MPTVQSVVGDMRHTSCRKVEPGELPAQVAQLPEIGIAARGKLPREPHFAHCGFGFGRTERDMSGVDALGREWQDHTAETYQK